MSLTPGTRLGSYEIVSLLGTGGMGEVYKAKDLKLGRDVAIKVLREDLATDPERLRRFEQEARAASALNHPNIVTIHDIGEHEGTRYIAMEYVEGKTLREMLSGKPLPTKKLLKLSTQIADGLAKAHSAGIVHRDLKPENLMVTHDGFVKILDFGLAKLTPQVLEAGSHVATLARQSTSPGVVMGTVGYMSPEQAKGQPSDFRSDQFSFGTVLYEAATGKQAFHDDTPGETQAAIIRDEPEAMASLNPNLPPPLCWIVERCLAKQPADRYASTRDLARELESLREHVAELSSEPLVVSARHRVVRRRRTAIMALGVLAAAVAFVVGLNVGGSRDLLTWKGPVGKGSPIVAVLPLANLSGDPSIDYVGVGMAHTLTASLATIQSVTMISPSATRQYSLESPRIAKLAQDLGATLVVTGAVQQSGERLHVTVNLVRPDESVVWGGESEGSLGDLFSLQRRLANGLSEALQLTLTPSDRQMLETPPTANSDAFGEFVQARGFLERPDVPGNLDRAITLFLAATTKDPRFALAHAGLAETYWDKWTRTTDSSWVEKARGSATEALRLEPSQAAVRYTLALIYEGTGRTDGAVDELRQTLTLQPKNDDAHRLLSRIFADRGRTNEAIQEAKKAIQIRPGFWRNHSTLGKVYLGKGRYQEAIKVFHRITELQPDLSAGFQALGLTYHMTGDLESAVQNYERAIELGPSRGAYSNLGTIYYRQGRYADAAQMYEHALELDGSHPATHRNLGDAYVRLGRADDARASYLRATELAQERLRVNPKDAWMLGALAVYLAKLGQHSEAARHAEEAVQLAPNDGDVLYRKAVVHALAGENTQAMRQLEAALDDGYSVTEAQLDDDLEALEDLPEFRKLLESKR